MKNYVSKIITLLLPLLTLMGCETPLAQSTVAIEFHWPPVLTLIYASILLTPIVSTALLVLSQYKPLAFKVKLQQLIHISLLVMLLLAWFIELSNTNTMSSRLDLIIMLAALFLQMLVAILVFISVSKQQKKHIRDKYFL
ncbi:hypothetical protein [Pseudoalteromonas sp. H105]|uniref:hypothetical protein n=1 Tax=Pseudoalteromonas sp. H105 TaxID=1348393 RepID=UPI000731F3D7|nr:hypothetical protein [Pseudoalteromonas sp. H105]KTF17972.1 hypothetical protein ATS75_00720 [Pseudoalteromonas sp. H105]